MGIDKGLLDAMKDHKAKLSGPHFLMSAENPKYPEKNELKLGHEQVLAHLRGAGFDAHEVHGHYGAPERSILIHGVDKEKAKELHGLAARLGQDSSIYSTGSKHEMLFHHGLDAGKKVEGEGTQWHKEKPNDFFTSLPGGQHHFTHNFNFDNNPQEDALKKLAETDKDRIKLVHYSAQPNLLQIDPKFKGKGVDAGTKGRDTEHPHSFFYLHGTEPEHLVASHAAHKYTTSISHKEHPIYDLGEDPHKFVEAARKENQGALNMDMVHEKIKGAGYHGFRNSTHPQLSNVVAMYHPLKVEHHEPTR